MATPASTFLNAFQAADNSARAWANQQLQQQQFYQNLARTAVAAEKERKAQDFNEMMDMLKRNDQNYQFDQSEQRLRDGQNIQAALGGYNAQTSRMGAVTSRINQQLDARRLAQSQSFNNDPLGLMGGDGYQEPALPQLDVPSIQDPSGNLFNFDANGRITSYGYANDPTPDSNSAAGIGAFVPTSEQEKIRRGEASDFRLRPGDLAVSPDLEAVFRRANIKPGTDVTLQYNDGSTHTGRWMDRTAREYNGKPLTGRFDIYSPDGVNPRDGMPARLLLPDNPEQALPVAAEPPILAAPEALPAFNSASAASVQAPSALPIEAQLPIVEGDALSMMTSLANPEDEIASPISFSGQNLDEGVSRQLSALRRESAMWKIQEQQAAQQARLYQSQVQRIRNPVNKAAYAQRAQQAQNQAVEARMQAAEAQAVGQQVAKDAEDIRKRQQDIGKLSVLDGVLPNADVQQIQADASNPLGGGITEQRIKVLQDYNEVRERNGLGHLSNGYVTAQRVAVAGKRLEEAKDDMKSFDKLQSFTADLAASGDDPEEQKKIQSKIRDVRPGAERWQKLKAAFDQTVAADRRIDPNAPQEEAQTAAPQTQTPRDDLFGAAQGAAPVERPSSEAMTQPELEKWSAAKTELRDSILGGRDAIKRLIASQPGEWTLPKFKRLLRNQLRNLEPADGEDFPSPGDGFNLPRNASSLDDVANALAEDMWSETGRKPDEATTVASPGISTPVRGLFQKIRSQKDNNAGQ